MKSLPKKIEKDTIIDSIVELRFDTSLPKSVIFGIIYNEIKDEFPIFEEMPLASLPESVRNNDPTLAFQALYRVKNDSFVVQIGTNMIAMSSFPKYLGWEAFTEKCRKLLEVVYKLNVISQVRRIGIRYINRFDGDISGNTNVNLSVPIPSASVGASNLIFHVNYPEALFTSVVQYRLELFNFGSLDKLTTVIDIDTSTEKLESSDYEYIWSKIEEGHNTEKRIFFDLLKEEYVKSLGPIY